MFIADLCAFVMGIFLYAEAEGHNKGQSSTLSIVHTQFRTCFESGRPLREVYSLFLRPNYFFLLRFETTHGIRIKVLKEKCLTL